MRRIVKLLFLSLIVVSCSKEALVEPNPPIVVPKVSVVVNADENVVVVPAGKVEVKGSTLTLSVNPKDGYTAIISVKGSTFSLVGNTYEVINIAPDDIINVTSKAKEVVVVPTRTDTIKSSAWHAKADDVWKDGKWVTDFPLDEKELKASYYFDQPNYLGKMRGYYEDGTLLLSCTWEWTGPNSIKIGSEDCTYKMTFNSLEIYKDSPNGNKYRDTFWR